MANQFERLPGALAMTVSFFGILSVLVLDLGTRSHNPADPELLSVGTVLDSEIVVSYPSQVSPDALVDEGRLPAERTVTNTLVVTVVRPRIYNIGYDEVEELEYDRWGKKGDKSVHGAMRALARTFQGRQLVTYHRAQEDVRRPSKISYLNSVLIPNKPWHAAGHDHVPPVLYRKKVDFRAGPKGAPCRQVSSIHKGRKGAWAVFFAPNIRASFQVEFDEAFDPTDGVIRIKFPGWTTDTILPNSSKIPMGMAHTDQGLKKRRRWCRHAKGNGGEDAVPRETLSSRPI